MKKHELKIDPDVFDDVVSGRKTFEIRYDDRGYEVGDLLKFHKTKHTGLEMANGAPLEYIGQPFHVYVTHLLRGPIHGLKTGWVIMSITSCNVKEVTIQKRFTHL